MTTTAKLDHISFTVPSSFGIRRIIEILQVEFQPIHYGRNGYNCGLTAFGNALEIFFHDKRPEKKIWVTLHGSGLEILRSMNLDVTEIIRTFFQGEASASCTEVHVALDTSGVTMKQIKAHADAKAVRGNPGFRGPDSQNKDYRTGGETVYFGGKLSQARLCCYDKYAESGQVLNKDEPDNLVWTRLEYRFRDEKAQQVALLWSDEDYGMKQIMGVCRKMCEFLPVNVRKTCANISRSKCAKWFESLFRDVTIRKFNPKEFALDQVERTLKWVDTAWCSVLNVLVDTGQLADALVRANSNRDRMKPKHEHLKKSILFCNALRHSQLTC